MLDGVKLFEFVVLVVDCCGDVLLLQDKCDVVKVEYQKVLVGLEKI